MSLLQKVKDLVRSRSIHVSYVDVGSCNGCDIEVLACLAPRYDIEQYGRSEEHTLHASEAVALWAAVLLFAVYGMFKLGGAI